jgi:hypothetical protein
MCAVCVRAQAAAGLPVQPHDVSSEDATNAACLRALSSVSVNPGVLAIGMHVLSKRCRVITDEYIDNPKARFRVWVLSLVLR